MVTLLVFLFIVTVLRLVVACMSGRAPWLVFLSARERRAYARELRKREQDAYDDARFARIQKEMFQ